VALSINQLSAANGSANVTPQTPKKSREAVADSWEDDLSSGEDETVDETVDGPKKTTDFPSAPPPTPAFGNDPVQYDLGGYDPTAQSEARSSPRLRSDVRPDKTDAAAKRMIAGALGIRTPRKTEEQKEYESALRKKEARRRDEERQATKAAEEAEKQAKAAIWSDQ
jgi:hypothetical protein